MALSKDWTVQRFFEQAMAEFHIDKDHEIYVRRFENINFATASVIGLFYDILVRSYVTEATLSFSSTGKYYSSGASWVASTKRLTATMDSTFVTADLGKTIVFRNGTSVYLGTIATIVSTTVVVVAGNGLPTGDIATVNYVMVAATTPTSDTIALSGLRIMRPSINKIEVISSETTFVEEMSSLQLSRFLSWAPQKLTTIAWSQVGENLLLKKGDSLTTYGTITLRYPRVPVEVTADTDYLDVPDGPAVDIILIKMYGIISQKLNLQPVDYSSRLTSAVNALMSTLGAGVQNESVKQRMAELI